MFGHYIYAKDGSTVVLDEDGILQSWQDGRTDNVDSTHPLNLVLYLPPGTRSLLKSLLAIKLMPFRAYETGAASGGGSTSGPSSASSSGASSEDTTGGKSISGNVDETDGNSWSISSGYGIEEIMSYKSDHNHGFPDGTEFKDADGNSRWWSASGGHGHGLCSHEHSFSLSTHNHGMKHTHEIPHTHSTPAHQHPITYGIYESTSATGVTVKINGTDRTTALGGPFYSDQVGLSIASFLSPGQWNTIELGSTQLGRIDASVFIQALMSIG